MKLRLAPALLVPFVLASAAPAAEIPASWIAEVENRIDRSQYEVARSGDEWRAYNAASGVDAAFRADGLHLTPRETSAPRWELGLTLVSVGRGRDAAAPAGASIQGSGFRVEYVRAGLTEWYVNDPQGLEQGFKLQAPPPSAGEVVLDLALTGSVRPTLDADKRGITFAAADGSKVARYDKLSVVDAHGRALPSRLELIEPAGKQAIRIVFDDAGAAYPIIVDPRLSATLTLTGPASNSQFGFSVSTAGDVNSDGYSDVIVGAPHYSNAQTLVGRAAIYLGGPNGLATTPVWTVDGAHANALFGASVAGVGDVNGDGYDDVLVGAYQEPDAAGVIGFVGKAYLYYGHGGAPSTTPAWTYEGSQLNEQLGWSVAGAGDVNGDGYADVIIGVPGFNNVVADRGRAIVFLGSGSGLAGAPVWQIQGDLVSAASFGYSVAGAGDVNGDGYDDVIVGEPFFSGAQSLEGRVYLYLGGPSGPGAAVWNGVGSGNGERLGWSVAGAGDVNGDGYADVILGAPGYTNATGAVGRAYLYTGQSGGLGATPARIVDGDQDQASLGKAVATAGDVNGDGYADVLLGAPGYNGQTGRVYLYTGQAGGLGATPASSSDGVGSLSNYGASVATAGDVDGDGFSDLIFGETGAGGTPGHAYAYRSLGGDEPSTTPAWTTEGDQVGSGYGVSVASAGDVNGDGYGDVIVGSYLYDNGETDEGKASLFLGGPGGASTVPAWTIEGNQTGAQLGISVASAGDVNGDGYADVLVGANGQNQVRVFYGSPSGLPSSPNVVLTIPGGGSGDFGYSVASAGDVNGDGYSDVIIGSRTYTNTIAQQGAAFVFLGGPSGLSNIAAWSAVGPQAGAYFGNSVASAGDVNGDGYSDVIIGAVGLDDLRIDEGEAVVYLGSPSGLGGTPVWVKEGGAINVGFGASVSSAGDVNGDGYSDVVVAGNRCSNASQALYLGGPSGLTPDANWTSPLCGAVAAAGDMDNDGYGDFLTWPYASLLHGSASGAMVLGWTAGSGSYVAGVGTPIASAGDVNGDGWADVIYGVNQYTDDQANEGAAFIHLGNTGAIAGSPRRRGPRQLRTDDTTPIPLLGKSDSPSVFRLWAPAFSASGRRRVSVQWEIKTIAQPFTGSGIGGTAPTDTGTPGASGSVYAFDFPMTGLVHGTSYHWRQRTISSNPLFPRSPWLSIPGSAASEKKLRLAGCVDADNDGYGVMADPACAAPAIDCDDTNGNVWKTPGEVQNVRFGASFSILWDAPADPGAYTANLVYDTIRSGVPSSFVSATCIESDDGPNTIASDFTTPAPGTGFYYLIRAQNACPNGSGTLGLDSFGNARFGRPCP